MRDVMFSRIGMYMYVYMYVYYMYTVYIFMYSFIRAVSGSTSLSGSSIIRLPYTQILLVGISSCGMPLLGRATCLVGAHCM